LFDQVKNENTPIIVERIVSDIDDVVRVVRFDSWQGTTEGMRDVKRALQPFFVIACILTMIDSIKPMFILSSTIDICTSDFVL
jgi:hypothetical protein